MSRYQIKVSIGVLALITGMIYQTHLSLYKKEPYPAIYLPGFSANGSEPILQHELLIRKGEEWVAVHYKDTRLGQARFRSVLKQVYNTHESDKQKQFQRSSSALIGVRGIRRGDTVRISAVEWMSTPQGYVRGVPTEKEIVL